MVNGKCNTLCPVTGTVVCVLTPHTACRSAAPMAGKVTHVNYTLFPTLPRNIGSRHYLGSLDHYIRDVINYFHSSSGFD